MENQDQNQAPQAQSEPQVQPQPQTQQQPQPQQQPQQNTQQTPPQPIMQGADQSKLWAILGYIIGFLFFIPLVSDLKNNQFSRFHANQQLVLFIAWIAKYVIFMFIPYLGFGLYSLISMLSFGINIVIFVFAIMGIISASKGEIKPLPIIGGIKII